jgi:hypothetical protein
MERLEALSPHCTVSDMAIILKSIAALDIKFIMKPRFNPSDRTVSRSAQAMPAFIEALPSLLTSMEGSQLADVLSSISKLGINWDDLSLPVRSNICAAIERLEQSLTSVNVAKIIHGNPISTYCFI